MCEVLADDTLGVRRVGLGDRAATAAARFAALGELPLRPAPLSGADTREICLEELGMSPERYAALVATGVLHEA